MACSRGRASERGCENDLQPLYRASRRKAVPKPMETQFGFKPIEQLPSTPGKSAQSGSELDLVWNMYGVQNNSDTIRSVMKDPLKVGGNIAS